MRIHSFQETRPLIFLRPDKLLPNPAQPRKEFDSVALASLAESLRENGMLQPLTVRKTLKGYELISGERRLQAAKKIAMKKVPCMVVKCTGQTAAIMALLENMQRKDLDVFEEADGIARLMSHYGLTQEEAASHLGITPSALLGKLQILQLTPWQQERIRGACLSPGHVKALLQLPREEQRNDLLMKIIARQLTLPQTEQLVRHTLAAPRQQETPPKRKSAIADPRLFANTIQNALSTMHRAGIDVRAQTTETQNFVQYTIQIPKLPEENPPPPLEKIVV